MFQSHSIAHSLSRLDERQLDDIGLVRQDGFIHDFSGRSVGRSSRATPMSVSAALWGLPSLRVAFRFQRS